MTDLYVEAVPAYLPLSDDQRVHAKREEVPLRLIYSSNWPWRSGGAKGC